MSRGVVMKVAAVDCGTNSLRLLIAESGREGGLVDLDRRTEIVRLGQGVDATGEFHPDALKRTFTVTERYARLITNAGVPTDKIHFVATSASRDAKNRDEFFEGIESRLGVLPDVISGDAEARLSFAGALSRVRPEGDPVLVMDIGGGSTEFIVGSAAGVMDSAISLDIGSVRLTERFLKRNPAGEDDLARAEDYDRDRVHGSRIPLPDVGGLLRRLSGMTVDEIRSLPSMHPDRADVITGGTLVAARVAERLGVAHMLVSESDILDGIALAMLGR